MRDEHAPWKSEDTVKEEMSKTVNEALASVHVEVGQHLYFSEGNGEKYKEYYDGVVTSIYPFYFCINVEGPNGSYERAVNKVDVFCGDVVMRMTPFPKGERRYESK